MAKFIYRGNPGYTFVLADREIAPDVGGVVELTDAEAASIGDEFVPARPAKTAAAKADDNDGQEG